MTDCAHWIPIMLEDEQNEHRESQRKLGNMKRAIDDIRSIINNAEADVTGFMPYSLPKDQPRLFEDASRRQLAATQSYVAPKPGPFGGLFGGVLR